MMNVSTTFVVQLNIDLSLLKHRRILNHNLTTIIFCHKVLIRHLMLPHKEFENLWTIKAPAKFAPDAYGHLGSVLSTKRAGRFRVVIKRNVSSL